MSSKNPQKAELKKEKAVYYFYALRSKYDNHSNLLWTSTPSLEFLARDLHNLAVNRSREGLHFKPKDYNVFIFELDSLSGLPSCMDDFINIHIGE